MQRTWSKRGGPVWNPGEQPVEGFSNPLYVGAVALVILIAPDWAYAGSVALNVGFMVGFLAVFALILEKWVGGALSVWGFALLCLSPLLWAVPGTGLETAGVLLVQAGLVYVVLASVNGDSPTPSWILILVAGASVTLRADGFILPLLCASLLALLGSRRQAATLALAVASVVAIMTALRLAYYGEPLPNTVYAKVAGGGGPSASSRQRGSSMI